MTIAILQPVAPPLPNQSTESHMLDMADHFKHAIAAKNTKIERMTKTLLRLYGIVQALRDEGDFSYIPMITSILDDEINVIAGLD